MVQGLRFIRGKGIFSCSRDLFIYLFFSQLLNGNVLVLRRITFCGLQIKQPGGILQERAFIAGFTKSSHAECGALILVMGNLGEAQVNWLLFESHTSVLLLDFLFIGGSPFAVAPHRYRSCLLATSEMQDLLPSCTESLESVLNLRLPCGLNAKALV